MRVAGPGAPGGGVYPPRSGYAELDTTLMPPSAGIVAGGPALDQQQQYRDSPSPANTANHPGYAGGVSPGPRAPRSSVGSLGGRSSVLDHQQQDLVGGRGSLVEPNYSNYTNPSPAYSHYNNFEGQQQELPPQQHQDYNIYSEYPGGVTPLNRPAPRAVFDEDDQEPRPPGGPRQPASPQHGLNSGASVQWRDPDLHEVIEFLSNPNSVIKANACAYLQHLCYMDDPVKAKTRQLGGIPPLVALLSHDIPEIHRNACGALRNLSFGRQNDENKRAIKEAGGTNALVRLIRKTGDNDVKELVTGVLWNLSSCDDLKRTIIDEALLVIVTTIIIPHSGWDRGGQGTDTHWTTVFRNSSGILRNVSSNGDYGRKKLRECDGLVDALIYLVRNAIERANIDNKSVENAVCVLRNLSYRAQEIEDPNYDKRELLPESRATAKPNTDNLGCFGASKNKGKGGAGGPGSGPGAASSQGRGGNGARMELLWQPEVVQPYLNLLSNCSNPETLEAAAGAIQNLSACYWQPSVDIRAAVRKEKGLPILVELLRMEVDRVVCAVATALRNLAIDQRNKELIGKYAMRDLVQKLPSGNPQRDVGTSDDTIAAVLATLNEVIKKHPEFSRSLMEAGGVDRLMNITRQRAKYSSRVVKFASQVLFSMWQHQELREVYKKSGWKEADFVTKTVAARNARPNSPSQLNSTLNRPMASQGGTRYEDRTMLRASSHTPNNIQHQYTADSVPMENLSLYSGGGGGGQQNRMYPQGTHMVRPGEPVYAQVNRESKKRSRGPGDNGVVGPADLSDYSDHARHWTVQDSSSGVQLDTSNGGGGNGAHGDSWV